MHIIKYKISLPAAMCIFLTTIYIATPFNDNYFTFQISNNPFFSEWTLGSYLFGKIVVALLISLFADFISWRLPFLVMSLCWFSFLLPSQLYLVNFIQTVSIGIIFFTSTVLGTNYIQINFCWYFNSIMF